MAPNSNQLFPYGFIPNEILTPSTVTQITIVNSISLKPTEPNNASFVPKREASTQPVYERVDGIPSSVPVATSTPANQDNFQIPRYLIEAIRNPQTPNPTVTNTDSAKDHSVATGTLQLQKVIEPQTAKTLPAPIPMGNCKKSMGRPMKYDADTVLKQYEDFKIANPNGTDKEFCKAHCIKERSWFSIKKLRPSSQA